MDRKAMALCAGIVIAGILWWAIGRGGAAAAGETDAAPGTLAPKRDNVELTVYAQDFGMVRETRPVSLSAGDNVIPVTDVSKKLDPRSVLLDWKPDPAATTALPQIVAHTYDLGVASAGDLLNRYLGRQVELVRYGENGHESERQRGALMIDKGGLAVRTENKLYINPEGTIVTPADPGVATIPQLSVQATSPSKLAANLDVAYLTRGMNWSADYVGTLGADGKSLRLECWASVTNQSGVDYPNAKVTLVAGTPNRAVTEAKPQTADLSRGWYSDRHPGFAAKVAASANLPVASPEAVGDMHAYPVKSATTIGINRMNRLLMMSATSIPAKTDYNSRAPQLDSWSDYYWGSPDRPTRGKIAVSMSFRNREADGLGQPLPRGAVRIYEPDSQGTLRYGGASGIGDTPKNEKVQLTLASSFDLLTEHRIMSRKRIDRRTTRKEVEVTLHNAKNIPVELRIVQPFGGTWKVVTESHKHAKLNAYEAQWKVPVPASSQVKLRYGVDLKY